MFSTLTYRSSGLVGYAHSVVPLARNVDSMSNPAVIRDVASSWETEQARAMQVSPSMLFKALLEWT